jgi:hypothetical protein
MSRKPKIALAASAAFLLTSGHFSRASDAVQLDNPDAEAVYLLQREYSNTPPDLNALAQTDPNVQNADEFHKTEIADQVASELKQREAVIQGIKIITVNLDSQFDPYDSDYQEYDFDISDGTYISYTAFNQQVQIDLTNGTDAQTWSLKPDLAQKVLNKTQGTRSVTLALTLELEASPPGVDGQPLVLNAKILSYDVLTQFDNFRLGHVDVTSP